MEEIVNTTTTCIVGMGNTGLRVVSSMSGLMPGVECIGIKLVKSGSGEGISAFEVIFSEDEYREKSLGTCIINCIGRVNLIILVANLDEGLECGLELFCEAAKSRFKKLILVTPEPIDASSRRGSVITNIKTGDVNRPYKITFPEAAKGMVNNLYSMILVNHQIIATPYSNCAIQKDVSALTEYLLHQVVEMLIHFMASKPSCISTRFVQLRPIWQKAVRYGVGIGSGQWKSVVAVERAISSLKLQAVHSCNIEGVLCQISRSITTTPDDIQAVKHSLESLLKLDTPAVYGITVDEHMDDDSIVVSIMAAEKLWSDIYSLSEHWSMACSDETRSIPAFERKKWYK